MNEGLLLNSPFLLLCFIVAAAFCIYEANAKPSGYLFPIVSGIIFTAAFVYLLLNGGTLQEALIVALVFFLLNVPAYNKWERQE